MLNGDTYGAQLALALAPLRAVPGVGRTRPSDLAIPEIRRQRTARGVVESWTWTRLSRLLDRFQVYRPWSRLALSPVYLRCTEYSVTDLARHGR